MGDKEKKEKNKDKDKDKKEKKEKHKDKEGKEKKEKKEKREDGEKENPKESKAQEPKVAMSKELDQRKLFKDGQKFLTPPVADATRAFYESLIKENPESKIATKFCVEYGLFAQEQHKTLFKRYVKLKEKGA